MIAIRRCSNPCGRSDSSSLADSNDLPRGAVDLKADLMGSQLTTLTSSDIQRLRSRRLRGVRQAFAAGRPSMDEMCGRELEDTHGKTSDDRSSWRQICGRPESSKRDPNPGIIPPRRVRRPLSATCSAHPCPGPAEKLGSSLSSPSRAGAPGMWATHWHWEPILLTGNRSAEGPLLRRFQSGLGRAAKRRNRDPFRVPRHADSAGGRLPREPAGAVSMPLLFFPPGNGFRRSSSLAHGSHGQAPPPSDRKRRVHGRGNHPSRAYPSRCRH